MLGTNALFLETDSEGDQLEEKVTDAWFLEDR